MAIHHHPFDDLQLVRIERNADDCLFHWNLVIKAASEECRKSLQAIGFDPAQSALVVE